MYQKQHEKKWLINVKQSPRADLRLFCFPYAGGAASSYRTWPDYLPPNIELWAVELPGRATRAREPAAARIRDLVPPLVAALRAAIDRPFAVFGHSMGAALGFEVVRALHERYGVEPVHLFVSGHRAPHLPRNEDPIHHLPEEQLIEKLREFSGTPQGILDDPEMMQIVLPYLRKDFEAAELYEFSPGPRLACPVSAYGGLGDEPLGPAELDAWREHTSGPFSRRMFPGKHFYIHSAERLLVTTIARELLAPRPA
jgi:medium-chain acyl-[acyl-carrier-protein] hydrolase